MALAMWVRSRITFWAFSGLSQSCGSSADAFSSSRRRSALSQSKMPPQQGQGRADLPRQSFDLGTHDLAFQVGALRMAREHGQSMQSGQGSVDSAAAVGRRRGRLRGLLRHIAQRRALQGRLLVRGWLLAAVGLLIGLLFPGPLLIGRRVRGLAGDHLLAAVAGIDRCAAAVLVGAGRIDDRAASLTLAALAGAAERNDRAVARILAIV